MTAATCSIQDVRPFHALSIIAGLHVFFTSITAALAIVTDAPFVLWFHDAPILLAMMLALLLLLGIVWDGSLVGIGLVMDAMWRLAGRSGVAPLGVVGVRSRRFFTCGLEPAVLLLATAITALGTSNITLLNLELLSQNPHWRDPFLWGLEGAFFEQIAALSINTSMWDRLYHGAWGIELFAAFALIVIGRGSRTVLYYCVTLIFMFYIGRLLGVLNPVRGPAFFRPDVFAYLNGSVTGDAMRMIVEVMALPPEQAKHSGGILLGGVSAMPSLHVAMVAVTAFWLAYVARWTLWATIPWVLLVWTSTVVLGWHYMVDGVGGIALGALCVWITMVLLRVLRVRNTSKVHS